MRSRIAKFEILRLLGNGSMGEVYLARDERLGREVAIKTIIPGNAFGAESRARFQQEARAMAALNHPNVITLYDFGMDDGIDYLAMEYLDGEELAALIGRKEVAKADLLEALAQACDGLAYAHERGIIHRDVKPGNILVSWRGGRVTAKLMDFGIASLDRPGSSEDEQRVGTAGYMAPEYLQSGQASVSGDLFAAGVILYEILSAGRKPFIGDTIAATLVAVLGKVPAALRPEDFLEVPDALQEVVARALAKDPAQRYPGAEELAAAIRKGLQAPLRSAPAQPEALLVGRGGGANCLSLAVALRQVKPGGRIQVLPGIYRETILVDKDVTIQGADEPSQVQFPGGISIAAGATLSLERITVGHDRGVALCLLPGARVDASDCDFLGAPAGGTEMGAGAEGRFLRCRFTGNGCAGLLALDGAQAFLEDCELSGNLAAGMHACSGAAVQLHACRIVGNRGLGGAAVDGGSVALKNCRLSGNEGPGLLLHRGGSGRLEQCQVLRGSIGIICHPGSDLVLEDCRIQGTPAGALLLPPGVPEPSPARNQIEGGVTRLAFS